MSETRGLAASTVRVETMAVPTYPEFVPLGAQHKAGLESACEAARVQISELTFAYLWVWRRRTRCRLTRVGETLVLGMCKADTSDPYLLPPVTAEAARGAEVIREVLAADRSVAFARVPEAVVEPLGSVEGLVVTEEPERADYVYVGEHLRWLGGRAYHGKRNHVRRFQTACPAAAYRVMDDKLAEQCAGFCRRWLAEHPGGDSPGLVREVDTTVAMLAEREWLGLTGGVLLSEGRVMAFALGEALNRETFVVRAEKAEGSVAGAYQAMNQMFACYAGAGYRWINREQDLGLPGLRRAKQSYHPHHLVRKFRIAAR